MKYASYKRKVFISNIPPNATSDMIKYSMRNIGEIEHLWLFPEHESEDAIKIPHSDNSSSTRLSDSSSCCIFSFRCVNSHSLIVLTTVDENKGSSSSDMNAVVGAVDEEVDDSNKLFSYHNLNNSISLNKLSKGNVNSSKNPLATFTSIDMSIKKLIIQKKLLKVQCNARLLILLFPLTSQFSL